MPDKPPSDLADHAEDFAQGRQPRRGPQTRDAYRTADQRGSAAHPAGHAARGAPAMIHDLTIGHLDDVAIPDRMAVAVQPLDEALAARVLAAFPGLKVER